MNGNAEFLSRSFEGAFLSPYIRDDALLEHKDELAAWRNERETSFRDGRDLLFYSNIDFRLGLFTAPSSLDLTSKTFMVYPLLDERVARFASSLSVFDRVSERVVFAAMCELNPDLAMMPLFGEIWRFDRSPDKRDFPDSDHNFQDGFEKRQPRKQNKDESLSGPGDALIYDADIAERINRTAIISRSICDSTLYPDMKRMFTATMDQEIEHRAAFGKITEEASRKNPSELHNINAFILRAYIASFMFDGSW